MHDIGAESAPDREAEIARLEITLLKMLKRIMRPVVGVTGQMHLAGNIASSKDRNRNVRFTSRLAYEKIDYFGFVLPKSGSSIYS
jgi:hypothetical protein